MGSGGALERKFAQSGTLLVIRGAWFFLHQATGTLSKVTWVSAVADCTVARLSTSLPPRLLICLSVFKSALQTQPIDSRYQRATSF